MNKHSNSWGATWCIPCLALILTALLAVAGCGGGGGAALAPPSQNPGPVAGNPGGSGSPAAPVLKPYTGEGRPLGAPLPSLAALTASHASSAAGNDWPGGSWPTGLGAVPASGGYAVDATGPQLVDMSGGSFRNGNLHLESDANDKAWAVFRVSGLGGMDIGGIGLDGDPSVAGQEYQMAAGDFGSDEWDFSGDGSGSNFDWSFDDPNADYTSDEGDGYFAVVVPEGGACCCCDCLNIYPDDGSGDTGGDPGAGYDEPCSGDGTITELSATTITLEGVDTRSWELTDATEYYSADGSAASAADFAAGDYVFIAGEPCADSGDPAADAADCCEAMAVFAYDSADGGDPGTGDYADGDYYYGEGVVDSIGGGMLSLDGEELSYDADTVWYDVNDEEGTEADFHAGDYIEVLVEDTGAGYYIAEAYNYGADDGSGDYSDGGSDNGSGDYTDGGTDDGSGDYTDGGDSGDGSIDNGGSGDTGGDTGGDAGYIDFSETVSSIGGGQLVTSGHTLNYDENTLFVDVDGNEIGADSISAGDSVYVEASDDGEGLWADYVELEPAQ